MAIHRADERNISAVRKPRMALDARTQSLPLEIEIVDKEHALRIAYVEDRTIAALNRRVQLLKRGRAHIHLETELEPITREQP